MVQSLLALVPGIGAPLSLEQGDVFQVRLAAAKNMIKRVRVFAGYSPTVPTLNMTARETEEATDPSDQRVFFRFGGEHIVIDGVTLQLLAYSSDIPGPLASYREGSVRSLVNETIDHFLMSAGINRSVVIASDEFEVVPQGDEFVSRGYGWETPRPGYYWSVPFNFEFDNRTKVLLSFVTCRRCNLPSRLEPVDTPESAWNKVAAQYMARHRSTSWVERISPLITYLDDPNNPGPIGATEAPDYASCRATSSAWIGFSYAFKVYVNGVEHHWAHGVVDGKTGNYVRTGSSGGFGSPPKKTAISPWSNFHKKKFTFSLCTKPGKGLVGKIVSVSSTSAEPSGEEFLVSSGAATFLARFDRKAKSLRWNNGNSVLEAKLDSDTSKSLIKLSTK